MIQQKQQPIIVRRTPPAQVLEEVALGNKFIVLEKRLDHVPEGYCQVQVRYKGDSLATLVPEQLMTFMANPGEGSIDDALDQISDFYGEVGGFEDEQIAGGNTSVQGVNWAMTARNSYEVYLINKLTSNGNEFDRQTIRQLSLDDPYVEQRVRAMAALCLQKNIDELKAADLGSVLKHVTVNTGEKELVETIKQEKYQVKCDCGSHYEYRDKYRNVTIREWKDKTIDTVSLESDIGKLQEEIDTRRTAKGSEIGRHDHALIRQYANMAYIIKENPKARLDVKPPKGESK